MVQFLRDGSTELVPYTWVMDSPPDLKVFYSPPPDDSAKKAFIRDQIKAMMDFDVSWDAHDVAIKGRASNYHQFVVFKFSFHYANYNVYFFNFFCRFFVYNVSIQH